MSLLRLKPGLVALFSASLLAVSYAISTLRGAASGTLVALQSCQSPAWPSDCGDTERPALEWLCKPRALPMLLSVFLSRQSPWPCHWCALMSTGAAVNSVRFVLCRYDSDFLRSCSPLAVMLSLSSSYASTRVLSWPLPLYTAFRSSSREPIRSTIASMPSSCFTSTAAVASSPYLGSAPTVSQHPCQWGLHGRLCVFRSSRRGSRQHLWCPI